MRMKLLLVLMMLLLSSFLTACDDGQPAAPPSQQGAGNAATEDYEDADGSLDAEIAAVSQTFEEVVECHNAVIGLINTGNEAGVEYDPDFVVLTDTMAQNLMELEPTIRGDGLYAYSEEELAALQTNLDTGLEKLQQAHSTLVAALEAAGYTVE